LRRQRKKPTKRLSLPVGEERKKRKLGMSPGKVGIQGEKEGVAKEPWWDRDWGLGLGGDPKSLPIDEMLDTGQKTGKRQ